LIGPPFFVPKVIS